MPFVKPMKEYGSTILYAQSVYVKTMIENKSFAKIDGVEDRAELPEVGKDAHIVVFDSELLALIITNKMRSISSLSLFISIYTIHKLCSRSLFTILKLNISTIYKW